MKKVIIIGNSVSAFSACQAFINSIDFPQYSITVISEEKYLPYRRDLLVDYLCGTVHEKDLFLCPQDFYSSKGIVLEQEREVTRVDLKRNRVILKSNDKIEYDYLIISSGSKPVINDIPGKHKDGVFVFYSLDDAKNILQKMDIASCVNIVGDPDLSLRLAGFFLSKGKEVKIISRHKPDTFALREKLEWIDLLDPAELIGEGSELKALKLDNGKIIAASLVIFNSNYKPSVNFLKDCDIKLENGYILVNENMHTNIENVLACGSVCRRSNSYQEKSFEQCSQEGVLATESVINLSRRGESICQKY